MLDQLESEYRRARELRDNAIVDLYRSNTVPVKDITSRFGLSHSQLSWLLHCHGVTMRKAGVQKGYRRGPHDKAKTLEVLRLYKTGLGFSEIARQLNTTRQSVYALVKSWIGMFDELNKQE